jgi:hypothetical protein
VSTIATGKPAHRTPKGVRVALVAGIALVALVTVAQGTIALIDLAARQTTTETQRFGGVRSIVIGDAGDVRLTAAPAGAAFEVRTKITEGLRKPSHDARVTGGGSLVLTSTCGWVFGNSCGVDYEVRVPVGTRVDVQGGAGDVRAEGLRSSRPVRIEATSGDLDVTGVSAPALRLHAGSGDIHAIDVRAADVLAGTSSGDVHVSLGGPADRLKAITSSGDLHLEVPDAVYRLDTAAGSGEIHDGAVRASPGARRSITASTDSGDIHIATR